MAKERIKRWKAGQCVTINGKRYRVIRKKRIFAACDDCAFSGGDEYKYPCSLCLIVTPPSIPDDCILTEIKPKS